MVVAAKDTKTGQSLEFRSDNVMYEDYLNMSDKEIAALREKRAKNRNSLSGKVVQTYIPEEFKRKNLVYEWMLDDPINLKKKMADGWVVVSDEKLALLKGCSTSSVIKIPAGTSNKRGEPEYLVLMAIHESFYNDDVLARKERIKALNDRIDKGEEIAKQNPSDSTSGLEVREVEIE